MRNWNVENYVFRLKIWNRSYNSKFYEQQLLLFLQAMELRTWKRMWSTSSPRPPTSSSSSTAPSTLSSICPSTPSVLSKSKSSSSTSFLTFSSLYIQVSSSCSWDVWSVCVSPSHTHPSLHPKVYIMIWSSSWPSSSWPSSRPSSSWPWPWWSSSSY